MSTERSYVQKLTTELPKLNKMKVKAGVVAQTDTENKELASLAFGRLTESAQALYTCECARSHARTSCGGGFACLYVDAFACLCVYVHDTCACSRKALGKFVDECNNALCIAEMLDGEQIEECKASLAMQETLSAQAETHTLGVKAAYKKYAEFKI